MSADGMRRPTSADVKPWTGPLDLRACWHRCRTHARAHKFNVHSTWHLARQRRRLARTADGRIAARSLRSRD
eukprot:2755561-Alexandrium_andersonii.AAC.1